MKTKKHVIVDLYGMEGVGLTKAEAKVDAEAKLTRAITGYGCPKMVRFPAGYVGLVYHNLYGFNYSLLSPGNDTRIGGTVIENHPTRQDAERSMRRHVAQYLIFLTVDNGLSVILDEGDRREHAEYIAWQLRYQEYQAQGYNDTDGHHMACESRAFCPPAA